MNTNATFFLFFVCIEIPSGWETHSLQGNGTQPQARRVFPCYSLDAIN